MSSCPCMRGYTPVWPSREPRSPIESRCAMVPHRHRTNHCPRDPPHPQPPRIHRVSWPSSVWFSRRGMWTVFSTRNATRERREEAVRFHRRSVAARGVRVCLGVGAGVGVGAGARVGVCVCAWPACGGTDVTCDGCAARSRWDAGCNCNVDAVGARAVVQKFLTEPPNWNSLQLRKIQRRNLL